MKARHASESKKAEEGDDPSDSKAEQGDVVGVPVRQEVDVEEVPGSAEAGDQRLFRRGLMVGTMQLSRSC